MNSLGIEEQHRYRIKMAGLYQRHYITNSMDYVPVYNKYIEGYELECIAMIDNIEVQQ